MKRNVIVTIFMIFLLGILVSCGGDEAVPLDGADDEGNEEAEVTITELETVGDESGEETGSEGDSGPVLVEPETVGEESGDEEIVEGESSSEEVEGENGEESGTVTGEVGSEEELGEEEEITDPIIEQVSKVNSLKYKVGSDDYLLYNDTLRINFYTHYKLPGNIYVETIIFDLEQGLGDGYCTGKILRNNFHICHGKEDDIYQISFKDFEQRFPFYWWDQYLEHNTGNTTYIRDGTIRGLDTYKFSYLDGSGNVTMWLDRYTLIPVRVSAPHINNMDFNFRSPEIGEVTPEDVVMEEEYLRD